MAGRSGFILAAATAGLAVSDVERMDAKNYDMTDESIIPFDLWIEKMINLIDEYYMLKNK